MTPEDRHWEKVFRHERLQQAFREQMKPPFPLEPGLRINTQGPLYISWNKPWCNFVSIDNDDGCIVELSGAEEGSVILHDESSLEIFRWASKEFDRIIDFVKKTKWTKQQPDGICWLDGEDNTPCDAHRWNTYSREGKVIGRVECQSEALFEDDPKFLEKHPEFVSGYYGPEDAGTGCVIELADTLVRTACDGSHPLVQMNKVFYLNSHGEDE